MSSTEFMLRIAKELGERGLAETTITNYLRTLRILNDNKPFKTLVFLKKKDEIAKTLAGYAPSTQKTLLVAITSVLALFKKTSAYRRLYDDYHAEMMKHIDAERAKDPHESSETQKENWVSWEEVQHRRNTLASVVDEARGQKTLTADEFGTLLSYLVLSLYTEVPPRRNQDYLAMDVVKQWTPEMPTTRNYLDLAGNRFVFNLYKTAKTYGSQTETLPASLRSVVDLYLSRHPLAPKRSRKEFQFPLLVNAQGSPLTAVNAITRILNRIFNKKVGSSALRRIYLTEKYGGAVGGMREDAQAMAHSSSVQRGYIKTDV